MSELVKELAKKELLQLSIPPLRRARPPGAINLGPGDPDFSTPRHIIDAAYKASLEGHTHYDFSLGQPELREAIAKYMEKFNIYADPNSEIIVTAGSYEALFRSLFAFLNPGDEVIVPEPRYSSYDAQIKFAGAVIVPVPFKEKRTEFSAFRPDLETLEKKITKKTKIILFAQPENPTGCRYRKEELKKIAELAIKNNLIVVTDEVYQEYIWGGKEHLSIYTFPGMKERTLIQMSFSKTFGMTGWRLGCVVSNAEFTNLLNLIPCAIRPPPFLQKAGAAALTGPWDPVLKMKEEYKKRIDYTVKRLNEMPGIFCPTPDAAFYLFPDITGTGKSSVEFCSYALNEANVIFSPGIGFGPAGEGHFRMALVQPLEILEQAMDNLETALKKL